MCFNDYQIISIIDYIKFDLKMVYKKFKKAKKLIPTQ